MQMPRKMKILMGVFLGVILCNFIFHLVFLDDQARQISESQRLISDIRKKTAKYSEDQMDPGLRLADDINKVVGRVPEEFSFTQLAVALGKLLDKHNLQSQTNLVFKPEKIKSQDYLLFHTRFSATGGYADIKAFIAELQNLPGIIYPDSVKILRIKENEPKLRLRMGLSILFRQKTI